MKYDDASWHYEGDFPTGLPERAAATHIAMFVSWAVLNGLAGELHTSDFIEDLSKLKDRKLTPADWFLAASDGKFTDEDLNDEGNRFALAYYGDANSGSDSYLNDYSSAFPGRNSIYEVPDDWATYSIIEPIIRIRFVEWRNRN